VRKIGEQKGRARVLIKYYWLLELIIMISIVVVIGVLTDAKTSLSMLLVVIVLYTAYRIWRGWATFRAIMDLIETTFWKMPLRYHNKDSLKCIKRKYVWGRKKDEQLQK